jgi:hypothetical protein
MAFPEGRSLVAAFHLGGGGTVAQRIMQHVIKGWTRHWSCHIELVFPHSGLSFSARGFDNEVGWKKINYSHVDRWRFIVLPIACGDEKYKAILDKCNGLCGMKYDYFGAVMKKAALHNGKYYCYESINHALVLEACNVYGRETWDRLQMVGGIEPTA